jgi:putative membrane-bound dehydrogenase-like protein
MLSWYAIMRVSLLFLVWLFVGGTGSHAQVSEPDPGELPRVPPTEPEQALGTFRLKPGFKIELAAAEPLVASPVALSFDESGRLFVVEMRDYSERRPERLGRIRLLEDTDDDGRFDKSKVFAQDLAWPTAVFCWAGGVFVGSTPDILFLKDTDGDRIADVREVVFSGFASEFAPFETNRLNVQALLNSFNWGLDNRIHGATSLSGGRVHSLKAANAPPVELRGFDFAFDPRGGILSRESGGGQHGMSFDSRGRKFVCSNSAHIRYEMYESRYADRNPFFIMPGPTLDIAVDGPAAEVYRISPDEPWRVIRTKWRVSGVSSGPIEGGGRPSGYFTGATGVTIYRGDAWPEEFREDAFIADCGSNLIHRKRLLPDGLVLKAQRPVGEEKVEFLASTDNWFRPVQMANGPDGALYVIDMYREVIEHPWSLPASLKKHLDLNSGSERGRIYRVVPDGLQRRSWPRLGRATTDELVQTLEHSNGWHRDTAARLLYERQDRDAIPLLVKQAADSKTAWGRMHSLYALDGLGALDTLQLARAMGDPDPDVRRHAVRLSEAPLFKPSPDDPLWTKVRSLTVDPAINVRYQLAFSLGQFDHPQVPRLLGQLARRDAVDSWMRAAILSSVRSRAVELFLALTQTPDFLGTPAGLEFMRQLARQVGQQFDAKSIDRVVRYCLDLPQPERALPLVRSLAQGIQRAANSPSVPNALSSARRLFDRALEAAGDSHTSEALRVEAIGLLEFVPLSRSKTRLVDLLDASSSSAIQTAAVGALAGSSDPSVADVLIQQWKLLLPMARVEAAKALLARAERTRALLEAVGADRFPRTDLAPAQIQFLLKHPDPTVRKRADELFSGQIQSERLKVVEHFTPALTLPGDPERGQEIYLRLCSSCHRLGDQGFLLGPDLVTAKAGGKEKLLISILDPNREVAPNYVNYLVETEAGETYFGLIAAESGSAVTLRRANGEESRIPRASIKSISSQNLSVMPEGLEAGLTTQDFANLLEFIQQSR